MAPRDNDRRTGDDRRAEPALPNAWLFQELSSLRELVTDQHTRLRTDMANGFASMRTDFRIHERLNDAVELRVHDLEYRERTAAATITKRNVSASAVVSMIVGPLMAWLFKRFGG